MTVENIADIVDNVDGTYEGNLRWYFKVLFLYSTNRFNDYHNLRHMLHVTWEVYHGCLYHKVDPRTFRSLLIAAMFHDYDHSSLSINGQDDLEIERAVRGFDKYMDPVDVGVYDKVILLVRTTEFPPMSVKELSLAEMIIRDADMSQTFSVAWIQQVLFGLSREMGLKPEELLGMQEGFLRKVVTFHSEWGKKTFDHLIPAKIAEAKSYLRFLAEPDPRKKVSAVA